MRHKMIEKEAYSVKTTRAQFQHSLVHGVFGALTVIIDILVFRFLMDQGINYSLSTTFSFLIALGFAFLTNRKWALYDSVDSSAGFRKIFLESMSFFLGRLGIYIVNLLGLIVMIQVFRIDPFLSKVFLNVSMVVLSYAIAKTSVYKDYGYP